MRLPEKFVVQERESSEQLSGGMLFLGSETLSPLLANLEIALDVLGNLLRSGDKTVNVSLERAIVRRAVLDAATGKDSAAINRGLRLVERYGPKENVSPWNLSRLSDDELDVFEALLGKISDDETGPD